MLSPREAIRTLPSYHPPLAGRADGSLRLDFNENTVGCSPRVVERLDDHFALGGSCRICTLDVSRTNHHVGP